VRLYLAQHDLYFVFLFPDQESGEVFRLILVRPYVHPDLVRKKTTNKQTNTHTNKTKRRSI